MRRLRGFTLIELAVVLVILTILAGGLLMPVATRIKNNQIQEARRYLGEVNEALIGFAIHHEKLPCPSSDEDGKSDNLSPREGFLPWQTIGVAPTDPWGNTLRYRIGVDCVDTFTAKLQTGTTGDINIKERDAADKSLKDLNTQALVAAFSLGPNGKAAVPAANVDEQENATSTSNNVLVTRLLTDPSSGCSDTAVGQPLCEFDDQLLWIDANLLRGRLSSAGVNLTD
jgi:prepilin-type N-terminal cleavage/methylation domain-containing protein